jgi:hypothetical protein
MSLPPLNRKTKSADEKRSSKFLSDETNPFKLPNDDQIFRLREEERKKKELGRETISNSKIWDKNSKTMMSRSARMKDLIGEEKLQTLTEAIQAENDSTKIVMPRRQEKENITEFVTKKREMFLVQMSLDTKREEIRKLEEKAQMKEEALQRSEQMFPSFHYC